MAGSAPLGDRAPDIVPAPVDMQRRSIRATGWRSGFVEFEFTLGDPLLTVELVMPPAAFAAFCAQQRATVDLPKSVAARLAACGAAMPPLPA